VRLAVLPNRRVSQIHGRTPCDQNHRSQTATLKIKVGTTSPLGRSFFFLAELILDLELEYDNAIKDYCGSCTACLDACPTDAITEPYVVDGSKCISYFTIELKDEIPAEVEGKFSNWIFGCDICQDVCPWNSFSKPHNEERFQPSPEFQGMTKQQWIEITEEVFKQVFSKSALQRTKFSGLKRNVSFVIGDPPV
jgi:epoxyqueuosine reductase